MSRPGSPVFVQRRTYRLRRMADAARLLPIFGGVLFLVPLLWKGGAADGAARTASVMFYLFPIWVLLIVISAFLSRYLTTEQDDVDTDDAPGAGSGESGGAG